MSVCCGHWSRLLLWLVLTGITAPVAAAERFVFHHEQVLGTSLEIQLDADSETVAKQAESRVLEEIKRLAKVFSTYDSQSEFSRWQQAVGTPTSVSRELLDVLAASDHYRKLSGGAFNPAAQQLSDLWKQAEKEGPIPSEAQLAHVVNRIQQTQWSLDAGQRQATRHADGPLTLNAIAKGTIIDAAAQAGLSVGGMHGILVAIGGDLRVAGQVEQPIHVANPFHDEETASPAATIYVQNRGVATSGNYRRGFNVAGRRHSHIFDPRTGQPVEHIASATVIASTAQEADALATTFSILPPAESSQLAARLENVEYFLIDAAGAHYQSSGWKKLSTRASSFQVALAETRQEQKTEPAASKKDEKSALLELVVKFELGKQSGAQYRRPYVAVWLEDEDEFPVRTALLFLQTKQDGSRWHRDLLRWYRLDKVRKLAGGKDLIGTISSATRGPGEYKAVFDGKDDAGQPLALGKYTLFIEAAREHGTYQLIKQPLELGAKPIAESQLKGNVEIKSASYEYRKPVPSKGKEK